MVKVGLCSGTQPGCYLVVDLDLQRVDREGRCRVPVVHVLACRQSDTNPRIARSGCVPDNNPADRPPVPGRGREGYGGVVACGTVGARRRGCRPGGLSTRPIRQRRRNRHPGVARCRSRHLRTGCRVGAGGCCQAHVHRCRSTESLPPEQGVSNLVFRVVGEDTSLGGERGEDKNNAEKDFLHVGLLSRPR